MDKRVLIYISATKQTTTAIWNLEGIGATDNWVAVLSDIPELKPFAGFSNVSIKFHDRERKADFYYTNDGRLVQRDCCNLDFWVKENNKESEDKSMRHNVTITKEENRVIEEYWTMLAMRKEQPVEPKQGWNAIFIGDIIGKSGFVKDKKELDHSPMSQEIAQFLSDTKADFVSVEHNYRFADLPFC